MNERLRKGIFAIFMANILNLIFNLLTNFLLPKYLSVDSYAAIKTFQLYTMYIGIFALGYSDGMYLRYGGKELKEIDTKELKSGMYSFRIMMIIQSVILIPIAIFYKNKVVIAFVLTIFTMNMISYFKNLYQAVGEFKTYGKILNWITIATFAVNMILLFVVKTDDYFIYLILYAIVDAMIWLALELNIRQVLVSNIRVAFSRMLLIEDIKSGFLLMIGNFSNIILSSMDRWFVKIMMQTTQFAYYSFAVSMEGFLNIAITPITTTLYNFFCNHLEDGDVVRTRRYVLIFGTVIVSLAFPAEFFIEFFLKSYIGSIKVLFILFATEMIYIIIKGIYVNLYKATRRQKLYFIRLICVLAIGAFINYVFVKIYPYKEAFAYGTLVSAFIWLIFSIIDFRKYVFEIREWLYLIGEVMIFLLIGESLGPIVGFSLYIVISIVMALVLMRKECKSLINVILRVMK